MDLSESQKKTVYGVEYRSMQNACHGLLVYKTESQAISASRRLREMDAESETDREAGVSSAVAFYDLYDLQIPGLEDKFKEIDYRDISRKDGERLYETDEYLVKIVNAVAYDVYA